VSSGETSGPEVTKTKKVSIDGSEVAEEWKWLKVMSCNPNYLLKR
jgi:hypothetical protein